MERNNVFLLLALVVTASGCVYIPEIPLGEDSELPSKSEMPTTGYISEVIDGDTVKVSAPDLTFTVRLIGVDTPETQAENTPEEFLGVPNNKNGSSCLERIGENATTKVQREIGGEYVKISYDPQTPLTGGYERVLAYIYTENGTLMNEQLIEEGYGRAIDTEDYVHKKRFHNKERKAVNQSMGLWGECFNPS